MRQRVIRSKHILLVVLSLIISLTVGSAAQACTVDAKCAKSADGPWDKDKIYVGLPEEGAVTVYFKGLESGFEAWTITKREWAYRDNPLVWHEVGPDGKGECDYDSPECCMAIYRVTADPGAEQFTDYCMVWVIDVDLSAQDLDGTVAEADEEDPGAYVHYNVDNDNGNTQGGQPIADYTEDDTVSGENDLKKVTITLSPIGLENGSVELTRSNGNARVWSSATKGTGNKVLYDSSAKTWDLSVEAERNEFNSLKSNLWVEGVANGSSTLTVRYKDPEGQTVCSDAVKYTFIAALCGDQPTPTQRSGFGGEGQGTFPNLVHCEWSITGAATSTYNCIAWSVDITNEWWDDVDRGWPTHRNIDDEYGDGNGTLIWTELDAFYADTGNKRGDDDFELLEGGNATPENADVMYYHKYHAARKKGCSCGAGKWIMYESKCGEAERIEHVHDQLDGELYGIRVRYYGLK